MKSYNSPLTCPDVVSFSPDISRPYIARHFSTSVPSSTRDFTHLARISLRLQIYLRHAIPAATRAEEKPSALAPTPLRLREKICAPSDPRSRGCIAGSLPRPYRRASILGGARGELEIGRRVVDLRGNLDSPCIYSFMYSRLK